ncbi:protease modulator HflC [Bradyrhizobium paxllaeri]|uniref:protease modulator HflC n=1 Tax=Bradyrhizobium paxllaeri TaxID=190148 RepID=UPI00165203CD|nr:protease modulator HflC [Bradyrhizobium paxllaeri]
MATTLCLFAVGDGERAVVTSFGRPVQVVTTPGLGVKLPYESVTKFDGRLFVYQPPLNEFLTLEKTAVTAAAAVLWRISEPKRFFETVLNKAGAESRLGDILSGELGAAIGRSPLAAFVSTEAYRAEVVLVEVAAKCRNVALRDYGIEVLDVQLLRFDFPKRNRLTVYARMRSERAAISMRYRSEGEEEGLKIRSAAQGEKTSILAEAFKVAQWHRGAGEAEAARIYADSLSEAPQFYALRRTLDASRKFVKEGTTMVLPANSDLFGLLYDSGFHKRAKPPASLADSARKDAHKMTSGDLMPPP